MATHSSVLAWRIPGTGEPGGCSPWGRRESTPERLSFLPVFRLLLWKCPQGGSTSFRPSRVPWAIRALEKVVFRVFDKSAMDHSSGLMTSPLSCTPLPPSREISSLPNLPCWGCCGA